MSLPKADDGTPKVYAADGKYQKEEPTNGKPREKRWWTLDGQLMAEAVSGVVKNIHQNQAVRLSSYTTAARLYGNLGLWGPAGLSFGRLAAIRPAPADRVTLNIIQSIVDTALAKLAKNKPRPLFLTSGGNFKQMRRAKKLNKFVDGIFYENKAYELGNQVRRDGLVFGTGAVRVYSENGRVCFERVLAGELYADDIESIYGSARQLHYVKMVDRGELMAAYPKFRDQLLKANPAPIDPISLGNTESDMVQVKESWHLRSGPRARDGVYAITCGDIELYKGPWKKDYFPFAFWHWNKRLFGMWGQGVPEQLQSIQLEINRLLWVIQQSLYMAGTYKILVKGGSRIVKEHLNNLIGAIIEWQGDVPPSYVLPPAVQPELYEQLERLVQKAYEITGISQLQANSQKPAGLDSGKALREFTDIGAERFNHVGQADENFFLQLARLAVDEAREVARERGEYPVKVPGRGWALELDWEDVDLDADAYVMQMFPVSSLPTDPAGRMQTITEYVQAGWLTPRQGRRLLNFPDLEAEENQFNAAEDYLEMVLDKMVDEGEYTSPDEYDDLMTGRELALAYYEQGKCHGLAERKLELLRRFMGDIDEMMQQAQATQAAAQNAQPGTSAPGQIASPVGAQPAPPQVSPLLPQQ